MITAIFGANWRTTLTNLVAMIFTGATAIAAAPSELDMLPHECYPYRGRIMLVCGIIAFISRFLNGTYQKDKAVTGGAVQQTLSGDVADPGTQTLVDATLKATVASGEKVTPAQAQVASKLPTALVILISFAFLCSCQTTGPVQVTPDSAGIAAGIACSGTLTFGIKAADQPKAAAYVYSVAAAIRSTAGGKIPTPAELGATIALFTKGAPQGNWTSLTTSLQNAWSAIYPTLGGNVKLAAQFLESIAAACEAAAQPFLVANPAP